MRAYQLLGVVLLGGLLAAAAILVRDARRGVDELARWREDRDRHIEERAREAGL